jgi:hypothetical protein
LTLALRLPALPQVERYFRATASLAQYWISMTKIGNLVRSRLVLTP